MSIFHALLASLIVASSSFVFSETTAAPALILVEEGQSTATIILPANAGKTERHAAEELQFWLKEISGASLPIAEDVSASAKKIRLGIAPAGTKNVRPESYHLHTRGDDLLITGGGPRGLLYGVYALLEEQLGCRWLTPDANHIPRRKTVTLPALDVAWNPPFEYREPHGAHAADPGWAARNRMNAGAKLTEAQGNSVRYVPEFFVHTAAQLVPAATHFEKHPGYYALVKGKRQITQLCMTHPEVREIALEEVRRQLRAHPGSDVISVSQNDGGGPCDCTACKVAVEREGTQAGPILEFVNFVAAGIREEFPTKAVETLAYFYSEKPPKFLKPLPNVIIRLCSYGCCSSHPLESCAHAGSTGFRENLEGWNRLTQRIWIWDYTVNYAHLLQPFPNFLSLQSNVRYFAAHGVKGVFEEGDYRNNGGELQELRLYLIAKLLWNPDCDLTAAREDFLRGYYGPAADDLRQYLNLQNEAARQPAVHAGIYDPPTAAYLTPEFLAKSAALFDHAETAVTNQPDLLRRVRSARLGIDYVSLANWKSGKPNETRLSREEITGLAKRFLAATTAAKVKSVHEKKTPPEDFVKTVLELGE